MPNYVDVLPLDESYEGIAQVLYFWDDNSKPLAVSLEDGAMIGALLGGYDPCGRVVTLSAHPDGVRIRVTVTPH